MINKTIRIATRKSPLALWQANFVAAKLKHLYPAINTELIQMVTRGDKILDAPLAKVGGKGLFVKELEQGMIEGHADIAVHSMKDVPIEFPNGLHLAVVMSRDDPSDALVSNRFSSLNELPDDVKIGTSSLRRQCQIKNRFPQAEILSLRGNVNTRLNKLDAGDYDVIILASAGLKRLDMGHRIKQQLAPDICLPAIGQGAIGIECRVDDAEINQLLTPLHDSETSICITAERALNKRLNGGCQVPIAGFAQLIDGRVEMSGLVGSPDGSVLYRSSLNGLAHQAEQIGQMLADDLLAQGADKILHSLFL